MNNDLLSLSAFFAVLGVKSRAETFKGMILSRIGRKSTDLERKLVVGRHVSRSMTALL